MTLLERQARLLNYLTNESLIFEDAEQLSPQQHLMGIDTRLLHLEARASHNKRMGKIVSILPKTFELIGDAKTAIVREFVRAYPSDHIGGHENARQFCEFLRKRSSHEPSQLPCLADVAAFELACARVMAGSQSGQSKPIDPLITPNAMRRNPNSVLLRCQHDIRSIFRDLPDYRVVAERDTPLAIIFSGDVNRPRIVELHPKVFDFLARLDNWTDCAMSVQIDDPILQLSQIGLIEFRM